MGYPTLQQRAGKELLLASTTQEAGRGEVTPYPQNCHPGAKYPLTCMLVACQRDCRKPVRLWDPRALRSSVSAVFVS